MDRKELAYAKQTVLAVKDWDAFQKVMRTLAILLRPPVVKISTAPEKRA